MYTENHFTDVKDHYYHRSVAGGVLGWESETTESKFENYNPSGLGSFLPS